MFTYSRTQVSASVNQAPSNELVYFFPARHHLMASASYIFVSRELNKRGVLRSRVKLIKTVRKARQHKIG